METHIFIKNISNTLNKFTTFDLDELNIRLNDSTLYQMFKNILDIKNDSNYTIETLKQNIIDTNSLHNNTINTLKDKYDKQLIQLQNDIDFYKKELHNSTLNINELVEKKSLNIANIKTEQYNDIIRNIKNDNNTYINQLKEQYNNTILQMTNQHKYVIDNINKSTISQDFIKNIETNITNTIINSNNINNKNSNTKGQFGEDIIRNIANNYNLCDKFYLEDTTHLNSNGDFIAHNIYPNIDDTILIESKFVKNIKTYTNNEHGKSDLSQFINHYEKYFHLNPKSHAIFLSMNSDNIHTKGSYSIESYNGHYIFYVSLNYNKIDNINIFQDLINMVFKNIVYTIVNNINKTNTNINNNDTITLLESTYIKTDKTIKILEKTIQDNINTNNILQLQIIEKKDILANIIDTFKTMDHNPNLSYNNDILITDIYKYIKSNNSDIDSLLKSNLSTLKSIFPNMKKTDTKKSILHRYNSIY